MASEELDKIVENYQKNCTGGEYDYLDTNHLKRAFEYVYNKALYDFIAEAKARVNETTKYLKGEYKLGIKVGFYHSICIAKGLRKVKRHD